MKPKKKTNGQGDFFKPWLFSMLNPSHELYKLASKIDWDTLERQFTPLFTEKTGTPAKPVRLVLGVLVLQHMYGFSDEGVILEWIENPYWQFFCGEELLQWEFPLHPSSLSRWRKQIAVNGFSNLLQETIQVALRTGTVQSRSLKTAIVDTTVMEKTFPFPQMGRRSIERFNIW